MGHDDSMSLDEARCTAILDCALAQGVNYIAMGYPYDWDEQLRKCRLVRQVLHSRDKDEIKLFVTLPADRVTSIGDLNRDLDRYRNGLQIETIDFGLLGNLNRDTWPRLQSFNVLAWMEKTLSAGGIKYVGFSFHDHFRILKGIIGDFKHWACCQMRYSFLDMAHNPGTSGLRYAADQGLAVLAVDALRHGRLAHPPSDVAALWDSAPKKRSPIEWALRFAWNNPAVSTIVRIPTNMDQLQQVLDLADQAQTDSLTIQEEVLISKVAEAYRKRRKIACPACRPCLPCPENIDIPRIFEIYNEVAMFDEAAVARQLYEREGHQADHCIHCEVCMKRCTKCFPIVDLLDQAHRQLGGKG